MRKSAKSTLGSAGQIPRACRSKTKASHRRNAGRRPDISWKREPTMRVHRNAAVPVASRDAPDYPKISEMPSGPLGVFPVRGRDTTARNRLCRARSPFVPQRFVIQHQEILWILRMLGVQLIEQRSQCGTRRGIAKNGVPTVSWKFTGAQRGNILHKLAARFRRQFGNGFFNFQQRFHETKMLQGCETVNQPINRRVISLCSFSSLVLKTKTQPELLLTALNLRCY